MRSRSGYNGLRCTLTLTLVVLGVIAGLRPWHAQAVESSWHTGSPLVEVFFGESPIERLNYNIDCIPERGLTRHADTALLSSTAITEKTIHGCAIQTPYGSFIEGHLRLGESGLYGVLGHEAMPIPGSTSTWRRHQGTPWLGSVVIEENYPNKLSLHKFEDGQIQYNLAPGEPVILKNAVGHPLNIDYGSIAFSRNGEWMITIADERLARINLRGHEVFQFETPQYPGQFINAQTAITNDGRYVAMASSSFNQFGVYDLAACQANGFTTCEYRDLLNSLPPPARNDTTYLELRFLSNYTLAFYRRDQIEATVQWNRYRLTAAGHNPTKLEYLAMGDSFTSGDGAYEYSQGTDNDANHCRVSASSYPFLIARRLGFNSVASVACSGARIRDIFSDQLPHYEDPSPIVILERMLPGYISQATFQQTYQPNIITLSIGGNDIGFGRKLLRCAEPDSCYASYEDRLELVREINSLFDKLVLAYGRLRANTPPNGRIYVVSYPELINHTGACSLNVRFDADEVALSNLLIRHLNQVIRLAAQQAGVGYIDAEQAFYGHRLCEGNAPAVNGLTVGDDLGPIGSESYHPNQLGHELLARLLLAKTDGLQLGLPLPDPDVGPPTDDMATDVLRAPRSGRPIYRLNYDDDLTNNIVVRNGWWGITVAAGKFLLKPFSEVRAVLQSQPTELGTFTTDNRGGLAGKVFIPDGIPAGYHTLHLYGQNPAGEAVDIYKIIYISDGVPSDPQSWSTPSDVAASQEYLPPESLGEGAVNQSDDGSVSARPILRPPLPRQYFDFSLLSLPSGLVCAGFVRLSRKLIGKRAADA